jgi:thiol-disulfide isomerase/thioredoxin
MNPGTWVALAAVLVALSLGLYRAATDGRFRGTHRVKGADPREKVPPAAGQPEASAVAGTPWQDGLGERATLLQFSSAFCAPCRATRRVLADVADATPGIAHIDVDAEHHLDVVRRLGILRTPTTLILDARGRELGRASGVPTKDLVRRALPPG